MRDAILKNISKRTKQTEVAKLIYINRTCLAAAGLLDNPDDAIQSSMDLLYHCIYGLPLNKRSADPKDQTKRLQQAKEKWESVFGSMDDAKVKAKIQDVIEKLKA